MLPSLSPSLFIVFLSLVSRTWSAPQAQFSISSSTTSSTTRSSSSSSSSTTATRTSTASSSSTSLSTGTAQNSSLVCNNSPLLCDRTYNNITHMGAHNSAFVRDATTGYTIAGNQYYNATVSLSAGIRLLQAQVHLKDGVLELCHSSCTLLDTGTLQSWLSAIKYWLDRNPNEVVTLLLVNSDNVPAITFAAAFERSGISTYGYVPSNPSSNGTTWPTLHEMITANTRLVTFIASLEPFTSYPYLLDEWQYVFETPYQVTKPSDFVCTIDRPSTFSSAADALESDMLPLMNHFAYTAITESLLIPNTGGIDATNSPSESAGDTSALGLHAKNCKSAWGGTKPVFVLVDFWDHGATLEAVDRSNGVVGAVSGRIEAGSGTSSGVSAVRFAGRNDGKGKSALVGFVVAVVLSL